MAKKQRELIFLNILIIFFASGTLIMYIHRSVSNRILHLNVLYVFWYNWDILNLNLINWTFFQNEFEYFC